VNSIREAWIALDTNEFLFSIDPPAGRESCRELIFEGITGLHVFVPLQVSLELQHNLSPVNLRKLIRAVNGIADVRWDFTPAENDAVRRFEGLGARKGDAVIAAQLEQSAISFLISENRHFLAEVLGLPFQVLSAADLLQILPEKTF